MVTLRPLTLSLLTAAAACAQLAAPNAEGVAMGHLHLNAADPEAQKKFWTTVIGARPYDQNGLSGVAAPGVLILLRQAVPTGPMPGSAVDHIGFDVPDLQPYYAKVEAAGLKHFRPRPGAEQMMIDGPDGLRVELSEDKTTTVPLRFHHVHFHASDPQAMQAWYAAHFGAVNGKRAAWDTGNIPGAELTFARGAGVPTQGRSLDHIGFEVRDLAAFCDKLTAAGVKLDIPLRVMPRLKLSLAFLTDPWGVRIELTEGLRGAPIN